MILLSYTGIFNSKDSGVEIMLVDEFGISSFPFFHNSRVPTFKSLCCWLIKCRHFGTKCFSNGYIYPQCTMVRGEGAKWKVATFIYLEVWTDEDAVNWIGAFMEGGRYTNRLLMIFGDDFC